MSFRDERDAQRLRIEALERELDSLRADLASAVEARDRAVEALERQRDGAPAARTGYGVGAAVYVEWRGTWWDATVLEVVGPSHWKIHYDGWSSRWDEVVPAARIAPRSAQRPGPRPRGGGSLAVWLGVVLAVALGLAFVGFQLQERSGAVVVATTPPGAPIAGIPLVAGTPVWVEWNGSWYAAVVLEGRPDGGTRVHYEGYSDAFDETVPPDRVRAR